MSSQQVVALVNDALAAMPLHYNTLFQSRAAQERLVSDDDTSLVLWQGQRQPH
jgi:hypothetical protein